MIVSVLPLQVFSLGELATSPSIGDEGASEVGVAAADSNNASVFSAPSPVASVGDEGDSSVELNVSIQSVSSNVGSSVISVSTGPSSGDEGNNSSGTPVSPTLSVSPSLGDDSEQVVITTAPSIGGNEDSGGSEVPSSASTGSGQAGLHTSPSVGNEDYPPLISTGSSLGDEGDAVIPTNPSTGDAGDTTPSTSPSTGDEGDTVIPTSPSTGDEGETPLSTSPSIGEDDGVFGGVGGQTTPSTGDESETIVPTNPSIGDEGDTVIPTNPSTGDEGDSTPTTNPSTGDEGDTLIPTSPSTGDEGDSSAQPTTSPSTGDEADTTLETSPSTGDEGEEQIAVVTTPVTSPSTGDEADTTSSGGGGGGGGGTVTDLCSNLAETQVTVPSGYTRNSNGTCTQDATTPPVDLCSNIAGDQAVVPSGFTRNTTDGTCTQNTGGSAPTDVCSNMEGNQATAPAGFSQNNDGTCTQNTGGGGGTVDLCSNLTGDQGVIPSGFIRNSNGTCTEQTGGGGSSGGGGGSVLLSVVHSSVRQVGVGTIEVLWYTNHAASSRVVYGTVSTTPVGTVAPFGYASSTERISNATTTHRMIISGLQTGVTYFLRPTSGFSSIGYSEVIGSELSITLLSTVRPPLTPSLLPDTASCPSYITDYMRRDFNNNSEQVLRLQAFLQSTRGYDVDLTGTFDAKTDLAVHAFQTEYADDILKPWGDASKSTGYVYITTKQKINALVCSGHEKDLTSVEEQTIKDYRSATTQRPQMPANGGNPSTSTSIIIGSADSSKAIEKVQKECRFLCAFRTRVYNVASAIAPFLFPPRSASSSPSATLPKTVTP